MWEWMEPVGLCLALAPLGLGLWNMCLYRTPAPFAACGAGDMGARPEISVLIPARNEEANIEQAVRCVLASRDVSVDLVVLDDASTDRTPQILAAIDDPRLRVGQAGPLPVGWSGKQHACAVLSGLARHDVMVFVDADVRLDPDALSRMAGVMQRNPRLGLASGFPRQVVRSWAEQLCLPLIHFLLLGFLPIAVMRASDHVAFGAGCGQLLMVRRDAYRAAGGHAAIRASMHDGLTLPRAFRHVGAQTDIFDASRFARCRMYHSAAEVREGLMKNATEGMATPMALPVWTCLLAGGQIAPVLWMILAPGMAAACAVAGGIGFRLVLAIRFRQPVLSALVHPLGVGVVLGLQWVALVRAWRGQPATWRGRAYPAP